VIHKHRVVLPILVFASAVWLMASTFARQALPVQDVISVEADRPGAAIASTMFGIFFEDINFSADGGLYPEQVKNRSFEFTEPLAGWSRRERGQADGELAIRTDRPLNENNPHYLRLRVHAAGNGFVALNSGFRGIGIQGGAEYIVSAYVRRVGAGPQALRATVNDERGGVLGEATFSGFTDDWKRYEAVIRPSATSARAQFQMTVEQPGDLDLDMVSLFPKETWNDRPNGLRKDLVQLLADLKPGFLRFPGGCIVEGRRLETRYQWKKTVGDVAERRALINRWADENERIAPDYYQSFGLGFYEYFQLAEDIGANPLPILNCGMACQFNSGEMAPLDQLGEYIQDALDLIEFANGPASSRWGGLRARMGHPAPFNLKMIGVGNEQWGARYIDRYRPFAAVLRAKHPEIQLISSAGPFPSGQMFDSLWGQLRDLKADFVDEHYYMPPAWFLANATRYDRYDRSGPKVFAGEYAAHTSGSGGQGRRNNWQGALAEAAFLTGLERNADVVRMASYAPLFAHVDAWQWAPDLIWFDNLRSFGTPSYYVQKLFGTNAGTNVLPVAINGKTAAAQDGLYASAALDKRASEIVLKVVNTEASARSVRVALEGAASRGEGRVMVLASADLQVENSLDQPTRLAPVESGIALDGPELRMDLQPNSVTVLRIPRGR
jgi:alpha-L-arabinofuranosidase